jgi:Zn-dependent protease with chaperone function
MDKTFPYPRVKGTVPPEFTAVSKQYKAKVIQVFLSMIGFFIAYFAILACTGVLIYYSFVLAILLLTNIGHWIMILAAVGVLFMGGLLCYFLLKFLFATNNEDNSELIEITYNDEPVLFQFIEEVCNECKTTFPKKIFISPGVNARVFYNSSFWSMFLPIRKNLEIGGGLISSLNITEFKAVIAHEFGHFSQSSTRLGSYVYRINRVIYNTIYENSSYDKAVHSLSQFHAIINLFLMLTNFIVRGIIWLLSQLYKLVNIPYMALSREMEFHADSVSVSVTGSNYIGNSLYRLEYANNVFNNTAALVNDTFNTTSDLPDNFYDVYAHQIPFFARIDKLELKNGLPVIEAEKLRLQKAQSRINIKDLWASHPETSEREASAKRVFIDGEEIYDSPWVLFNNPIETQKQLTLKMYAAIDKGKAQNQVNLQAYLPHIKKQEEFFTFKPEYCGYYSNFYFPMFTMDEVVAKESFTTTIKFADLFNDDNLMRLQRYDVLQADLATINAIKEPQNGVKRFEYEGEMKKRDDAFLIAVDLEKEFENEKAWVKQLQENVYLFFYSSLNAISSKTQQEYKELYMFCDLLDKDFNALAALQEKTIVLFNEIQSGKYDDDQFKHVIATLTQHYNKFVEFKDTLPDRPVPQRIKDKEIMSSYKDALFSVDVIHPVLNNASLQNMVPYINRITEILSNINGFRNKIYRLTIELQDEWIVSHNAVPAN